MYENMVQMSSISDSRADFYGKMIERTNNNNINMQGHSIFQMDTSNFRELSTTKVQEPNDNFLSFCGHESLRGDLQVQPRAQDLISNDNLPASQVEELKTMKRKASDMDLELDLSLKLNSRSNGDHKCIEKNEIDSNLSLSLYSQSSYVCKRMKEEQDGSKEQEKGVNISLDLTI